MNINQYQQFAASTALYAERLPATVEECHDLLRKSYVSLGAAGEIGEVANKIKKSIRDGNPIDRQDLKKELGDILWYVSQLATEYGLVLEDVIDSNVAKLSSRKNRGTLRGSGDDR